MVLAHHGFDLLRYPGDEQITRFIKASPFDWTGFHLGRSSSGNDTGCLPDPTAWTATALCHLQSLGIGIVPVYFGRARSANDGANWQSWLVEDADQAAGAARALGFPAGATIFLHLDRGRRLFRAQRAYVAGWTARIDEFSGFRGGAYCHAGPAATLRDEGYSSPIWLVNWACGRGGCPSQAGRLSTCDAPCFPSLGRRPEPGYAAHQYAGDVSASFGGICLRVNLSVAAEPIPGSTPDTEGPGPSADN